jgi:hypothetical protein
MKSNEKCNVEKNIFTRVFFIISFLIASVIGILSIFIEFKTAEVTMSYLGIIGTFMLGYVARRGYQDSREKKDDK